MMRVGVALRSSQLLPPSALERNTYLHSQDRARCKGMSTEFDGVKGIAVPEGEVSLKRPRFVRVFPRLWNRSVVKRHGLGQKA